MKYYLLFFITFASCAHVQTQLKCKLPDIQTTRDGYTQTACAGWVFGWDHETVLLIFFEGVKPVSYAAVKGSTLNTAVPLALFDRGMHLSAGRATHVTVMHNHLTRTKLNPNTLSPEDQKTMFKMEAHARSLGLVLHDFVVFRPQGHILSARHAGYLR